MHLFSLQNVMAFFYEFGTFWHFYRQYIKFFWRKPRCRTCAWKNYKISWKIDIIVRLNVFQIFRILDFFFRRNSRSSCQTISRNIVVGDFFPQQNSRSTLDRIVGGKHFLNLFSSFVSEIIGTCCVFVTKSSKTSSIMHTLHWFHMKSHIHQWITILMDIIVHIMNVHWTIILGNYLCAFPFSRIDDFMEFLSCIHTLRNTYLYIKRKIKWFSIKSICQPPSPPVQAKYFHKIQNESHFNIVNISVAFKRPGSENHFKFGARFNWKWKSSVGFISLFMLVKVGSAQFRKAVENSRPIE